MLDDPETTSIDDDEPVADGSVWAQMRDAHKAISEERAPLELALPGYEHLGVGARYRYVAISGSDKTVARLQKIKEPTRQALEAAAATIARACECIVVLTSSSPPTYEPLEDDDGIPVRFDQRLCENMGIPWRMQRGRELSSAGIVRAVFGGEQGEHRLMAHAIEVSEWMSGEREAVTEDFTGE